MLVTFLSSLVLRFSTSCYGCHLLALDLGVSQQVSTIYPSKPALCSLWGCLPQPEPEAESTVEEEEFDFDELELPEFSEEDALAAMADEPELPES